MKYSDDNRVVLTLDAGGTNFVFSAIQGNKKMVDDVRLPAEVTDLEKSLETICQGFQKVIDQINETPAAISFAFPGPADYPNGIIDNVGNLPAFAGGVALGPYLQEKFAMPVFINNDANLFVYGEAIAGLLPQVNKMLQEKGSTKRYENLFGVTLGTGFGGGFVQNGKMFIGDNSNATEVWLMRNKVHPECIAEEGASIRAVKGSYARNAEIDFDSTPSPQEIAEIADGKAKGNKEAALEAFRELGEIVGDTLSNAMTLFDGLVVIGGGISKAQRHFMPSLINEMNGSISAYDGALFKRLAQKVYNLHCDQQLQEFLSGDKREIAIPGTTRSIQYDSHSRIAVGTSVLDTSEAVSIGAYAFALNEIDNK